MYENPGGHALLPPAAEAHGWIMLFSQFFVFNFFFGFINLSSFKKKH